MKIVAVIDRIVKHLGYWFEVAHLAAPATGPPPPFYWSAEDFSSSQQSWQEDLRRKTGWWAGGVRGDRIAWLAGWNFRGVVMWEVDDPEGSGFGR